MVRDCKGRLADSVNRNLQTLRIRIHKALNGEDNYLVYLNIKGEAPIKFGSGMQQNELVINVHDQGIDFDWTKTSFIKDASEILSSAASSVIDGLGWIWGGLTSAATNAIEWY